MNNIIEEIPSELLSIAATNSTEDIVNQLDYEVHKAKLIEFVNIKYFDKKTTSFVIFKEKYDKVLGYLKKENDGFDPNFRSWIKKKKFCLTKLDGNDVLGLNEDDNILPVAHAERFFDIIHAVHSVKRGHVGGDKSNELISQRYAGIPTITSAIRLQENMK
jgi:hypothetical protein